MAVKPNLGDKEFDEQWELDQALAVVLLKFLAINPIEVEINDRIEKIRIVDIEVLPNTLTHNEIRFYFSFNINFQHNHEFSYVRTMVSNRLSNTILPFFGVKKGVTHNISIRFDSK